MGGEFSMNVMMEVLLILMDAQMLVRLRQILIARTKEMLLRYVGLTLRSNIRVLRLKNPRLPALSILILISLRIQLSIVILTWPRSCTFVVDLSP